MDRKKGKLINVDTCHEPQSFQNFSSRLPILGARIVTWGTFDTEHQQFLSILWISLLSGTIRLLHRNALHIHIFVWKEENCSNHAEYVRRRRTKYDQRGLRSPDVVQVGVSHEENGGQTEETIPKYTLLNMSARVRILKYDCYIATWAAHCIKPAVWGRSTAFCIVQPCSMI
jgi:hypothetical protein